MVYARAYQDERERAERLAEIDRAKTTFFTNVSHEFRTPLTLMIGPLEEVLKQSDVPARQRDQLDLVHRNSLRLLKLVNALLEFSRLEAGRIDVTFTATDLGSYTKDLVSIFRSTIENAGLQLLVECPPISETVYVDRNMWETIVLNLVSNAFKFTEYGSISVRQWADGGKVELIVEDTGSGIPADQVQHVFKRFHRIENSGGRTIEGTGIGLAMVQELVKLHGGTVRAESVEGKGSRFTVDIPLGRSHLPVDRVQTGSVTAAAPVRAGVFLLEASHWAGAEATADISAPSNGQATVLLADDNADMREYVRRLLSGRYRVVATNDGLAALAAVREQVPDLVLSDVMMPGLDGFGLLRDLRADPKTRAVPFIMLSARAGEESRVEGLEAGADDYLVKPFSGRELLARISANLELARIRKEMAAQEQEAISTQQLLQAERVARANAESAAAALQHSQRQLEDARRRLDAVLNGGKIATWLWEIGSDLVYADRNLLAIYDLPADYADKGLPVAAYVEAVHPEDRNRVTSLLDRAIADGEEFAAEYRLGTRSPQRWAYARARVERDHNRRPLRMAGAVLDITERKQAEAEREHLLEAERVARDEAERASRMKDEFLATLSHELRTPLNAILGWSQILKAGSASDDLAEGLTVIERNARAQTRIIEDLLDMSRIISGKVRLDVQRVDLAGIVQAAADSVRPAAEAKGVRMQLILDPTAGSVSGDANRLQQVFWNLLINAVKFTQRGGRVQVRLERVNSHLEVSVTDNGEGITSDFLPYVFDRFRQSDASTTRRHGGLGLGLAIVKQLIELHGGGVRAKSSGEGHGATFIVSVPVMAIHEKLQPDAENHHPGIYVQSAVGQCSDKIDGVKVLVVDDELDARMLIKRCLEDCKAIVTVAASAAEAISLLPQLRPDVLISDIGMPEEDGYSLVRRIRALTAEQGGQTPAVALTAYARAEDRVKAVRAGFHHHVSKPVEPTELIAMVASLVTRPS